MKVLIAEKENLDNLLADGAFYEKWQSLYDVCEWATVFQSPAFVRTWHEIYKNVFDLFFVYETDGGGDLTGLLPLAVEKSTGGLCAAGGRHAEYQTWLAIGGNGNAFIEKAFEALRQRHPAKKLQFLFLAPNTPLEWLSGKNRAGEYAVLKTHPRPLIALGDGGEKIEESLRKKGNKSRLRQLKKLGEVRLERLESPAEFEAVFDEIEDFTKLRLSALHNVLPANDPNRKVFHAALMGLPGLAHASLLKVGDQIASSKFALRNRDEMLLCMTSMSPFLSAQSPSKLHILMLGREFARNAIPTFDLSPGGGYKDRFATHYDDAYSLNVFFDKAELRRYKSKRKAASFTKGKLEKLHVTKNACFAFSDKARHKLKRVNYLKLPQTIAKNLARRVYDYQECRVYSFDVEAVKNLPQPQLMKRDSVADLLKFKPAEGWQFTTSQFHRVCLERFEEGNHSFTFAEGDTLLHYGWMVERQSSSYVFEVEQEFELPPDSAILYDYYTHPKARGRGLYKNALYQCLHEAARVPDTKKIFIGVLAGNQASRGVIEKIGFEYEGSLFKKTILGKVRKWQSWTKATPGNSAALELTQSFSA